MGLLHPRSADKIVEDLAVMEDGLTKLIDFQKKLPLSLADFFITTKSLYTFIRLPKQPQGKQQILHLPSNLALT